MNAIRSTMAIVSVVFTLSVAFPAYSYDWVDTTSDVKVRQTKTTAKKFLKDGYLISKLRLRNKTREAIEGKLRVVITDSLLAPVDYDGVTRLGDNDGDDFPYYWITREDDASLDTREWTDTINIAFELPFQDWLDRSPKWLKRNIR